MSSTYVLLTTHNYIILTPKKTHIWHTVCSVSQCSGWIVTANKWAALLLNVSVILPFCAPHFPSVASSKTPTAFRKINGNTWRPCTGGIQQYIRSELIVAQKLVSSFSLNCRPVRLMLLLWLLYPVSSPSGMQARGSWHPQLETAAQMSPALVHVCSALLTGN